MNIKMNQKGDKVITHSEDGLEIQDVIIPLSVLAGTKYLGPDRLGQIMQATRDYFLYPEITIPADAVDAVMPTFGAIVDATEDAARHRRKISKTRSDAAKSKNKQVDEDSDVQIPEIIITSGLNLLPIVRGGVTIMPQEYVAVVAICLIKDFKVGEQNAFYGRYAHWHWNDGAVVGLDARMDKAMKWRQKTGAPRFLDDPAAHSLLVTLLYLLPADKRIYLLADDVRVEIQDQSGVVLFVPEPIHGIISSNPECMKAVREYAGNHGLENVILGLNPIPFHIEMSNR